MGEEYELLSPEGLIDGMRDLGITDLKEMEIVYLLKVLSKPEINNAILMQEFMQIMENFGLQDDMMMQNRADGPQNPDDEDQSPSKQQKKKGEKALDLGLLDQKSVKIMVMLMLFLLENDMTAA